MSEGKPSGKDPKKPKFNYYWIYALVTVVLGALFIYNTSTMASDKLEMQEFWSVLKAGDVEKLDVINDRYAKVFIKKDRLSKEVHKSLSEKQVGLSNTPPYYRMVLGDLQRFENKIEEAQKDVPLEERITPNFSIENNVIGQILSYILPFLIIIAVWIFLMRKMGGGAGGGGAQIFNIGKSKATLFDNTQVNVTFKDVAGLDEAKEEVMEVVDFLKNPKKYTSLGGKIPKGVLLVGPPGTGKTLLAKAVAGESGVAFFSISGSDFVEMFVGVGASRVRDLFKKARDKGKAIIFVDEIDAIGRARGRGNMQGANDERENTLNQLLVEMDGFSSSKDPDKAIIMIAATNRPDVLDPALLRPGRFDRQIGVGRPDLNGREQIFEVHLKKLKMSDKIIARTLAEMTPGFVGADIMNVCNEAALIAARRNKKEIDMDDFNYALDRVIGGLEKKSKILSPVEKEIVAYHEAGHAVAGWFLEHAYPLVKVTIVPRGIGALGYAQYLPDETNLKRVEQYEDDIAMTMAGRAAEKIFFNKISNGAGSDLDSVTNTAYMMIVYYGMSEKVGNVSFQGMLQRSQFSRPYSDETAKLIDDEARLIIDKQYKRVMDLLEDKKKEVELIAQELLKKEVIHTKDVIRLIGERPWGYGDKASAVNSFGPESSVSDAEVVEEKAED